MGRSLGRVATPGTLLALTGPLGAGKTQLAKGVAEGLGVDPSEVSSPTFTLIQEYRGGRLTLFHIDLYRLQPREVDDLGLDEIERSGGVMAIEWPDRLPRGFEDSITVRIEHADDSTRNISIQLPDYPITRLPDSRYSDR